MAGSRRRRHRALGPRQGSGGSASWQLAKNRYGTGDLGTPGGQNGWSADPYALDASDLGWQDPALGASLFFSYFDQPKKAILAALATAKTSVHIAMFNLRDSSIVSALGALAQKGVDVQILLDKKQMDQTYNQPTLQAMAAAGLSPSASRTRSPPTRPCTTSSRSWTARPC